VLKERRLISACIKWYQSEVLFASCRQRRQEEDRVVGGLCDDCLQVRSSREGSQGDCRMMKLSTQDFRSDSSRSVRETDRNSSMATEGHKPAERKSSKLMSATKMDKELTNIKREMEKLEFKMRQNRKLRWVYEWPMKTSKMKWPVRELMARRQRRLLRRWLRYAENLRPIEREEMVYICEPEIGDILGEENDQRSVEDLEDRQEGSGSILNHQATIDEDERPSGGLMDSEKSSIQQGALMKMGSVDLMVCQGSSSESIPYCQMGRDELRSQIQPEELTEQVRLSEGLINSRMNLNQQM
jgi:hypothetical protein